MIVIKGFERSSEYWQTVLTLDENEMQYPWSIDQWNDLDNDLDILFVELNEDEVVGFALYRLSPLEKLAHLLKIVLSPNYRGQGLSQAFFAEQTKWLRNEQFERIFLEVSTANERANGLYRKLGFQILRRVSKFYQDGADAWTMEKHLESSI